MQKPFVIILVLLVVSAQSAQRRSATPAKPINYSKFSHATHKGLVDGVVRKGQPQELSCAYCHQKPTVENPKVTGYPNTKPENNTTHSACTDCHSLQGSQEKTYPKMCLICHASTKVSEMSKNVRPFPNPITGAESQFFDNYSHSDHSGYFELSATFKEQFKDKTKFKEKDNFECIACHSIDKIDGIKASAPGHAACFVCHLNEKEVPAKRPSFAANCVGCHAIEKKAKGAGSERAVLWFAREIIVPERNAAQPGAKPFKPFSHKTHEEAVGTDTKSCLECHATGKRADKRSDFFAADRRTQEKQPRAGNCVECHRKEMQQKIGGAVTLQSAKCTYCHALQTIRERGGRGVELPPPSHFYKKPAPTPAPKPPGN